jgi:hypothetical protein
MGTIEQTGEQAQEVAMIFDRPTTRIVPTTMLAVSIGMGGGYLLGYGIQTAAGEAGAHWVGLAGSVLCWRVR